MKALKKLLEKAKNFTSKMVQPFRSMTNLILTLAGAEMVKYFVRMALDFIFNVK